MQRVCKKWPISGNGWVHYQYRFLRMTFIKFIEKYVIINSTMHTNWSFKSSSCKKNFFTWEDIFTKFSMDYCSRQYSDQTTLVYSYHTNWPSGINYLYGNFFFITAADVTIKFFLPFLIFPLLVLTKYILCYNKNNNDNNNKAPKLLLHYKPSIWRYKLLSHTLDFTLKSFICPEHC